MSKINAALVQAMEELNGVHTPENGFARSCMEKALILEARIKLKLLRKIDDDKEFLVTK